MGYDVFSKRCGCGAIHPVRSTCPACIDRKRAEAVAKAGPDQADGKPGGWITRANTMLDPVKPVAERSGQVDALRYAFPDGLRAWLPEPALEFESTRIPLPGGLKLGVGADQPFDLRPHVGLVQLYSGKRPPSHEHAPSGCPLLFEAAPGDDAMTLASGIATFARLWGKDRRTALCDMSVSTTGGGGQVQLSTTRIPAFCELALNFDKIECTRDQAREMGLDVDAPRPYTNPQGIGQADHAKRELAVRARLAKEQRERLVEQMADTLATLKDGECAAYVFDNGLELVQHGWEPLLRVLGPDSFHARPMARSIYNRNCGVLVMVSRTSPGWEQRLRGRNIVAGNIPHAYGMALAEHEPPKPVERDIVDQLRDIMTGMRGDEAREVIEHALEQQQQTGAPVMTAWMGRLTTSVATMWSDRPPFLKAEVLDAARALDGMVEDRYGQLRRIGDTSPVVPGPNARFRR